MTQTGTEPVRVRGWRQFLSGTNQPTGAEPAELAGLLVALDRPAADAGELRVRLARPGVEHAPVLALDA